MKTKKALKRIGALGLCMAILLCASACGEEPGGEESRLHYPDIADTPSEKDSWTYIDEEFTIDWYVDYSGFQFEGSSAQYLADLIKEKTGVTINFTSPLSSDNGDMLNLMISGGTLPDVVSVAAYQEIQAQLALDGYVYPINVLAEKWAPSLLGRMAEQQDIMDYYSIGDNVYGLTGACYSEKYVAEDDHWAPNGAMLVRKDWYDEYVALNAENAKKIQTKAGLMEALEWAKTTKGSTAVPLTLDPFNLQGNSSVEWLSQYFAAPFEDENGDWQDVRTTAEYYEAIAFISEAYENGFVNSASLNSDEIGAVISQGRAFVTLVTPQNFTGSFVAAYKAGVEYIPLVVRNDAGDDPVLQDLTGYGWLMSMITYNCERPDLVIKVFDFLYSEEGQRILNFGEENDLWKWADEEKTKIAWTDKYLSLKASESLSEYGLGMMYVLYNPAYIEPLTPTNALKDYELYIQNLKRPLSCYSYRYQISWPNLDKSSEEYSSIVRKKANIDSVWGETLSSLITSPSTQLREKYDTLISQMESQGLDTVQAFYNKYYQQGKEAVGLTNGWIPEQEDYVTPTLRNEDGSFSDKEIGANGDPWYLLK